MKLYQVDCGYSRKGVPLRMELCADRLIPWRWLMYCGDLLETKPDGRLSVKGSGNIYIVSTKVIPSRISFSGGRTEFFF